jgi:uncharacterized protein
MKFLVVVLVIVVVLWLMSSRRGTLRSKRSAPKPALPEAMVACAHCGVHLPRSEAVEGSDGRWFCGSAHRLAAEQRGESER